jgi:hypothetical protein
MTPLTTRALLWWFFGLGALKLSIAHENDCTQGLIAVPALLLVFPLVTNQIARFQVDIANVALFVGYGFILVAFALGVCFARGHWREGSR